MRKSYKLRLVVLGLGGIGAAYVAWTAVAARPIVAATFARLGPVQIGVVIRHEFQIDNGGWLPLHLRNPDPGCGCTSAELSTTRVASGQVAKLIVTVVTADMQGVVEPGKPHFEVIQLSVDGARSSRLTFTVEFNPIAEFELSAYSAQFSGPLPSRPQTILVRELGEARIRGTRSTEPWVNAELRKSKTGGPLELIISEVQPRPSGSTAMIVLDTSSVHLPELRVLVVAG